MLPRRYRLPASRIPHFPGQRVHGRYLDVIAQTSTLPHDRLAIIISKKVFRLSTQRHALKRVLHLAAAPFVSRLPAHDYLIVAHPAAATDLSEYGAELEAHLRHLKESA